jgi:beta-glucosidase-like glycosyl hydrolase
MVGHLKIPALDAHYASSLSRKIICGLLRQEMNFKGLVITDAMNMHAVSRKSRISEARACLMALDAGADILLHPEHPEKVIQYLSSRRDEITTAVDRSFHTVLNAKKTLKKMTLQIKGSRVGIRSHWKTAHELTHKSIKVSPGLRTLHGKPIILILDDDNGIAGDVFAKTIKTRYPGTKTIYIDNQFQGSTNTLLNRLSDKILIAAVFSKISAWKGRAGLSKKVLMYSPA